MKAEAAFDDKGEPTRAAQGFAGSCGVEVAELETLETDKGACAAGGVTTFLEMPNTNPATTTPAALQDKLDRAAGRMDVDHAFYAVRERQKTDLLLAILENTAPTHRVVDHADAGSPHHFESGRLFEHLGRDLGRTAHCEGVVLTDDGLKGIGFQTDFDIDLESGLAEYLHSIG